MTILNNLINLKKQFEKTVEYEFWIIYKLCATTDDFKIYMEDFNEIAILMNNFGDKLQNDIDKSKINRTVT